MSTVLPALSERLTPNQEQKRRQIVDAAKEVLATRGLAHCTAREIAAASPLTKSAIHYYFSDMDLLVDLAMGEHIEAFQDELRAAGGGEEDPVRGFWRSVDSYLDTFLARPEVTHLWFEYWTEASRRDRPAAVRAMIDGTAAVFADQLERAGVAGAGAKGRAVLVHLMGTLVDQTVDPRPRRRTHEEIAELTGLAVPAGRRRRASS